MPPAPMVATPTVDPPASAVAAPGTAEAARRAAASNLRGLVLVVGSCCRGFLILDGRTSTWRANGPKSLTVVAAKVERGPTDRRLNRRPGFDGSTGLHLSRRSVREKHVESSAQSEIATDVLFRQAHE